MLQTLLTGMDRINRLRQKRNDEYGMMPDGGVLFLIHISSFRIHYFLKAILLISPSLFVLFTSPCNAAVASAATENGAARERGDRADG